MKKILLLIILSFSTTVVNSQNASTYFPASTGYKWFYKNTPLDSLNNPQTSLATFQIDSFATNTNYKGLPASMVLSKSGLTNINQTGDYTDTNYFNFQGTNGFYYLNVLGLIGNIPLFDSVAFIDFLRSFEAWYSTYRFSQTANTNYTIFTKDTTLNIDTLSLPLRISSTGRRLNDQTISTINGNILCKKFLITFTISYGVLPPFLYIPIVSQPDTVYIASNIWTVRDVRPSVNVDLTSLGFPISFSIPGTVKELTSGPTGIFNQNSLSALADYQLFQNYPNPFNPNTIISYELANTNFISIKIFDSHGKEVSTLVNEIKTAGRYNVNFDGSNLSSGIYFYRLEIGENSVKRLVQTKNMVLIK